MKFGIERKGVFFLLFACNGVAHVYVFKVIFIVYRDYAGHFAKGCATLGFTRFEKFFDTGKTLCNIARCRYTARMESTHRKLCTGFADGLRRNDADCFTGLDRRVCRHILAVALCAYAVARVTAEYRTN